MEGADIIYFKKPKSCVMGRGTSTGAGNLHKYSEGNNSQNGLYSGATPASSDTKLQSTRIWKTKFLYILE